MPPLRIAHVLPSFGTGGQERVVLELAGKQRAEGHRVVAIGLASAPEGPMAGELRSRGAIVTSVPKGPGMDPTTVARLARLFRRERVGIVHTHNPQPLIFGALAAKLSGAAVVHTRHGANFGPRRRLWLRRAAALMADAYVAVSAQVASAARRSRDCPASRLHVIENGVDASRYRPDAGARGEVRRELGIPPDAWALGTVGRLAEVKNQALLLRAAAPLLRSGARLLVVGDGPEAARLRAQASELGVAQAVHFAGLRSDVPRLLAALDAFALSSRSEGLPLVLLEAMATALPVVSTAVGGIPEVLGGGDLGFLAAAGDEGAFGQRLAALRGDPEAARAMGARARAAVLARHTVEVMTGRYMALYRRLRPDQERGRAC